MDFTKGADGPIAQCTVEDRVGEIDKLPKTDRQVVKHIADESISDIIARITPPNLSIVEIGKRVHTGVARQFAATGLVVEEMRPGVIGLVLKPAAVALLHANVQAVVF